MQSQFGMRLLVATITALAALVLACDRDSDPDDPKFSPEADSTPDLTQPWPRYTVPEEEIPVMEAPPPEFEQPTIKGAPPEVRQPIRDAGVDADVWDAR